jgi:nucleoside-diphosphate-sugar epimerase
MKAFLTGASGFIGTHLAGELLRRNWKVGVLIHKRDLPFPRRFQIFHGDIRDAEALKGILEGTDVLFHLAAALGASRIG